MPDIADIMLRLRDAIQAAFDTDENEFGMMLFKIKEEFDYANEAEGKTFPDRIWYTVKWHYRSAELVGLLELAQMVATKWPRRNARRIIVDELKVLAVPPPVPAAAAAAGTAAANPIPLAVVHVLELADKNSFDLHQVANDLRPKVREDGVDTLKVANELHLSESQVRRMAAVLALEHRPDSSYLQWLAERTIVEEPIPAYYATQALTISALRIGKEKQGMVRSSLRRAAKQLDNLVEDEDSMQLKMSKVPVDLTARKRQLLAADRLLDLRSRKNPPSSVLTPAEFDEFSAAVIVHLTKQELETILKNDIGLPLHRLANPADPMDILFCQVMVSASDSNWETDFISSVAKATNGNVNFQMPFLARFRNGTA